jgi:hypothetical protein
MTMNQSKSLDPTEMNDEMISELRKKKVFFRYRKLLVLVRLASKANLNKIVRTL